MLCIWDATRKFYATQAQTVILWAAHLGYLQAPRETDLPPEQRLPSRWKEYIDARGKTPEMPELGPMRYLAQIFLDAGKVWNSGMGITPLPYSEVKAIAETEGLSTLDRKILHSMSVTYLDYWRRGENSLMLPPWSPEQ